jgi:O-antigen/teichoic acid export membrane protein
MSKIGDTEFGIEVSIGFLGKVATAIVGLVGSIVAARIVGPTGYGVFSISMAITQFANNPFVGWAIAAKKRMTETDFNSNEVLGSVFIALGLMIGLGAPISYFLLSIISKSPIIPFAVPLLLVSTASYWCLNKFLSGSARFSLSFWSGTVSTLLQNTFKIALVIGGFGVWGIIGGTIAGPLLVTPLLVYWIGVRPSIPSLATLESVANYARWSVPNGFVGTALSRMDTVLLGLLATASAAGKYRVALQITMPAVFVSSVLRSGLMGRVSNLESRNKAWVGDLWNSLSYGSILAVPVFFGSLVLGETLAVTVFGTKYQDAGIFVIGLAFYRLISSQVGAYSAVISGLNRPDLQFKISFLSFVFNIALGILLWSVIGAAGIVIATGITAIVTYVATLLYLNQIMELNFIFTEPLIKQFFGGGVMASTLHILNKVVSIDGWVDLAAFLCLGAAIYFSIEISISSHFRKTALGIWNDICARYV